MKKLMALVLAVVLVLGMSVVAFAATSEPEDGPRDDNTVYPRPSLEIEANPNTGAPSNSQYGSASNSQTDTTVYPRPSLEIESNPTTGAIVSVAAGIVMLGVGAIMLGKKK